MILSALILALYMGNADGCTVTDTTITGSSMQGILWDGQKISVQSMECGTVERYDHVLFTHEETPNAVVKQLWGMPGDILRVEDSGFFYINDVKVLTPFKRPYRLLGAYKTRFKKLEGELTGYMLLGHPGSLDSARVGLIPRENFLGFVPKDDPSLQR